MESHKENKHLLDKMLQIMERPKISAQTSFQPRNKRILATFYNNKSMSRSNSKKSLGKSNSQSSLRSGRNSQTTTGYGPASLNMSQRKKDLDEIKR